MLKVHSSKIMPYVALVLFVAQLLLILASWILSAAFPMSGLRSLLSSEGLRWFLGHFAEVLSMPLLVWLLLLAMAYGVLRQSCLLPFSRRGRHSLPTGFRERLARLSTLLLAVVYVCVVLLLTLVPHAVLLSVTGSLWPSPFSRSLVPVVAFGVMLVSAFYGFAAGHLSTLRDLYDALLDGLRRAAPLLLFYVLIMQIYESLRYVLQQNPIF